MKIIFCIPGRTFSGYFLRSWSKLIHSLKLEDIEWDLVNGYHPIVHRARQKCLDRALKKNYDYLMWIDSDMVFESYDFQRLFKHDVDIISGLYLQQNGASLYNLPEEYACIDINGNRLNRFSSYPKILEVKANGMGWMLVKKGVFESIKKPFGPERDYGEDIIFQNKALEKGYKSYVDPNILVGHEKSFIMK